MKHILLLLLLAIFPSLAQAESEMWVEQFKQEAAAAGISQSLLDEAFADFSPIERVIALDRKQPEHKMTWAEYKAKVVPNSRVELARSKLDEHRSAITKAANTYGVNAEVITALWGVESNFGERQGTFEVVDALATLAYDGRRASYFRKELLNALKIIQAGHISLHDMQGSWAGAMGQCQFMPSSFLAYAQDGDGDGRKDIWNNHEDVFASIANYLSSVGWNATQPVAIEVNLPKGFDNAGYTGNQFRAFAAWRELGVEAESHPLLTDSTPLKLVRVGKGQGSRYVLASKNFDTLMAWNRSTYFVTAVALLSAQL